MKAANISGMRRHGLALALIALVVAFVYSNALFNGFVWDDYVLIINNDFIASPGNLRFLFDWRYYLGGHAVLSGTRPIFLASLFMDRAAWGGDPAGYHLTNILLHAANSGWVYLLALNFFPVGPAPLLAGLIFGLHPASTEAVNAVSFRSDLLAAFFLFPALWLYLKARAASGKKSALLIAFSAALYGLGLLSKEMAATLPVFALLAEHYFPDARVRRRRVIGALAAYAAVALAFGGFWAPRFHQANLPSDSVLRSTLNRIAARLPTAPIQGSLPVAGPPTSRVFALSAPPWADMYKDRKVWFWTTAGIFAGYFHLLAYPATLVADRAPQLAVSWRAPGAAAAVLLLILLAASARFLRRRQAPAGFGLAWCLAALLPVSGLLPLYNPVAERYLYVVSAGFAWMLAAALSALWNKDSSRVRAAALALAAMILALYSWRTYARNRDWESEETLFLEAPPVAGAYSPRAHFTRAGLLRRQGRPDVAARELEQALRLHPRFTEAWLTLAMTYAELGRKADAAAGFEKAVALAPRNPAVHFAFAQFLGGSGEYKRAVAAYRSALDLEPGYLQAWVNLAALHRDRGAYREAKRCYEMALTLAGQNPVPFYSYAILLERTGENRRAEIMYNAALSRAPGYRPARERLDRLQRAGAR